MARPCSSAAAITSASFTDPPGCTTAVAPAAATASRPSRNGKNASDAATEPFSIGAVLPFHPPALLTATFTASTRLIWPAPIASVRTASVKITVFDFTCAGGVNERRDDCPSCVFVEFPVQADDPAKGRQRICFAGTNVRFGDGRTRRHAARVGVLDHRGCRLGELEDDASSRIEIEQ